MKMDKVLLLFSAMIIFFDLLSNVILLITAPTMRNKEIEVLREQNEELRKMIVEMYLEDRDDG